MLAIDGVALIPSLAIRTTDRQQPWLFGADAADVRPGKGMVSYTNWKAGLFHRENDEAAAKAAIVAQAFFSWLRPHVEGVVGSLDEKVVRIMLPAFRDFKKLTGVTRQCMTMAGWRPLELETAMEPHANAIGLLTGGRNEATKGTKLEGPNFLAMFGSNNPYIEKARSAVLSRGGKRAMTIAIVDIGAFTTDLALLKFDLVTSGAGDDGLQWVLQQSFELGTYTQIDEPLWTALTGRYGGDFVGMSFREREEVKHQLFSGKTAATLIEGRRVQLGDASDAQQVNAIVDAFVDAIWRDVGEHVTKAKPDAVFLTGGGASINQVVAGLRGHCGLVQMVAVAAPAQTGGKAPIGLVAWEKCGYALERVATALGGASILARGALESTRVITSASEFSEAGIPEKTECGSEISACTCQGNPDCPRCGGSGYLSK